MKSIILLLKDESGNTAAEYALILALVGSAVALAAIQLGNTIADTLNKTSNTITKCMAGGTC